MAFSVDGVSRQALGHPLRVDLLRLLVSRRNISLREAAAELGEGGTLPLSRASYHVGILSNLGLVSSGSALDRGGMSFSPTDAGELLLLALDCPSEEGST